MGKKTYWSVKMMTKKPEWHWEFYLSHILQDYLFIFFFCCCWDGTFSVPISENQPKQSKYAVKCFYLNILQHIKIKFKQQTAKTCTNIKFVSTSRSGRDVSWINMYKYWHLVQIKPRRTPLTHRINYLLEK